MAVITAILDSQACQKNAYLHTFIFDIVRTVLSEKSSKQEQSGRMKNKRDQCAKCAIYTIINSHPMFGWVMMLSGYNVPQINYRYSFHRRSFLLTLFIGGYGKLSSPSIISSLMKTTLYVLVYTSRQTFSRRHARVEKNTKRI